MTISSADLRVITYDVTYDLRQSQITQVIRDGIAEDNEGTKVRRPITLLHLKVLSNADILVYYLSQSVQKQQNCGLKCRSGVRLTPTLATLLLSLVTPTHSVCTPQHQNKTPASPISYIDHRYHQHYKIDTIRIYHRFSESVATFLVFLSKLRQM